MGLLESLLETLPEGEIIDVRIGLRWTAVVANVDGEVRCGLCSTLQDAQERGGEPQMPQAGILESHSGRELAEMARLRDQPTLSSVGVAAMNALLPNPPIELCIEGNAEEIIATHGVGKRVAIIGRFHFIPKLRPRVRELIVLEQNPSEGEYPAAIAPELIPRCDLIAITGSTLANHTLESLLELCSQEARIMILGPSTPLSQVLFDYGATWLSGCVVTEIDPVLLAVSQGAGFRQIHQAGVQLVTLERGRFPSRA